MGTPAIVTIAVLVIGRVPAAIPADVIVTIAASVLGTDPQARADIRALGARAPVGTTAIATGMTAD